MKHLFGKLTKHFSAKDISHENLNTTNKAMNQSASEAALEHLGSLLASKRALIEMPAAWPSQKDGGYTYGESCNPLDMYLVIEPESEDSGEKPVAFQTSLQEVLSVPLRLYSMAPIYDEGLKRIADGLRELADEIDKTLSQRSRTIH